MEFPIVCKQNWFSVEITKSIGLAVNVLMVPFIYCNYSNVADQDPEYSERLTTDRLWLLSP